MAPDYEILDDLSRLSRTVGYCAQYARSLLYLGADTVRYSGCDTITEKGRKGSAFMLEMNGPLPLPVSYLSDRIKTYGHADGPQDLQV